MTANTEVREVGPARSQERVRNNTLRLAEYLPKIRGFETPVIL